MTYIEVEMIAGPLAQLSLHRVLPPTRFLSCPLLLLQEGWRAVFALARAKVRAALRCHLGRCSLVASQSLEGSECATELTKCSLSLSMEAPCCRARIEAAPKGDTEERPSRAVPLYKANVIVGKLGSF
jgi:hypothetical protein